VEYTTITLTFNRQVRARFGKPRIVFDPTRELGRIFHERFLDRQDITIVDFGRLIIRIIFDGDVVLVPGYFRRFAVHTAI